MLDQFGTIFFWLLVAMGLALAVAAIGLALMWRQIANLHVPREAGFFATMHYIPLPLVVLLDLLDFGLDIFAAPISWLLLDRLGLHSLRNKAALEALIPFTQPIPTFSLAWLAARLLKLDDDQVEQVIEVTAEPTRPRLPYR